MQKMNHKAKVTSCHH